jgi:hypothetical protein
VFFPFFPPSFYHVRAEASRTVGSGHCDFSASFEIRELLHCHAPLRAAVGTWQRRQLQSIAGSGRGSRRRRCGGRRGWCGQHDLRDEERLWRQHCCCLRTSGGVGRSLHGLRHMRAGFDEVAVASFAPASVVARRVVIARVCVPAVGTHPAPTLLLVVAAHYLGTAAAA